MIKLIVFVVVGGTGLLVGWFGYELIGRLFFWWAGRNAAMFLAVASIAAITLISLVIINGALDREQRGAITASGRRIVGIVYGLPFQIVGLAIGLAIMSMVLDMIAYIFFAAQSGSLDGVPQNNVGNFLTITQGYPVLEIILAAAFLLLAVLIGRDVAASLKYWAGRATKRLRRAYRLSAMGGGGSASFAGIFEEWRLRFHKTANGTGRKGELLLGGSFYDPSWRVGTRDDRGILTLASSRSGKGRSAIIPQLLTWRDSALVIDPKGTNAAVTAARRGHGGGRVKNPRDWLRQDVHILDPFRIVPGVESAVYNPLSAIDITVDEVREDIDLIADSLIVPSGGEDKHWDESAKDIIAGIIAHLLTKSGSLRDDVTLLDVRDVLRRDARALDAFFGEMSENHAVGGLPSSAASLFTNAGSKARGSFFTIIMRNTAWLNSVAIQRVVGSKSDFKFSQLKEKPTTVYVVMPPELLDRHSRFLRLLVNQSIEAASRGGKGKMQILYILDEFFSLGPLKNLEKGSGLLASYGVRLWPIVQNLSQLSQNYKDNWQTFFANAGAVQAFGVNDKATADYLQNELGRQVIQLGVQKEIRNLREVDEIGRDTARETGRQIIFRSGDDPLLLKRLDYDKTFPKRWYNPDPDHPEGDDQPPAPPPPPSGQPPEDLPSIAEEIATVDPVKVEKDAIDHVAVFEKKWKAREVSKTRTVKKKVVATPEQIERVIPEKGVPHELLQQEFTRDEIIAAWKKRGGKWPIYPEKWNTDDHPIHRQMTRHTYQDLKPELERRLNNPAPVPADANIETTNSAMDELESLIGLQSVKQQVKSVVAQIRIDKKRKALGKGNAPISRHMIFAGNPGTGKTTVARIIADIYQELGLLDVGQLIECGREGLVAEFVGQTAPKTTKKCNEALNGVLFIDEAYTLAPNNTFGNDYGPEAIATLLAFMENNRNRIIVIAAGYEQEMEKFLGSNPGLKSRFGATINFPDFVPDELAQIFKLECDKQDFKLSAQAAEKIGILTKAMYADKGKHFGNGRAIRNLFEACLDKLNVRLAASGESSPDKLMTFEADDIPDDTTSII